MVIKNAKVFTDEGTFEEKQLYIKDGIIVGPEDEGSGLNVGPEDEGSGLNVGAEDEGAFGEVLDAAGLYAIPGLIDIHFHGAMGHDFCDADPDGLKEILKYEASCGILAACPATMTFPEEKLNRIVDCASGYVKSISSSNDSSCEGMADSGTGDFDMDDLGMADLVGINMEGPFISPQKVAAQNPDYVSEADFDMFLRLYERSDRLIKLVDIAPEIPQNMDFIKKLSDFKAENSISDLNISLSHTAADYETAVEAFKNGASHLTHMFNAMNDIGHRAPGPVPAALESGATVELIADGVHNHDAILRLVFGAFDNDKIILISDSTMATGLGDGTYELGGQSVTTKGNVCTLTDHPGTIAGSNTNLYNCLKHAVLKAGIPLGKAVMAATLNPARVLKISDLYGSLTPGHKAYILLMDENLDIKHIIKKR